MRTALFHATYGKSELFLASLEAAGFARESIVAVSTQPRESRGLAQLLPPANLCQQGASASGAHRVWSGMGARTALLAAVATGQTSVGELLTADRHMRRFPIDMGVAVLNDMAERYESLLERMSPALVVGETANASEVLLAALCERAGVPYVQPATLRVPSDRFGLWLGTRSTRLWRPRRPRGGQEPQAALERWRTGQERPFYFTSHSQAPGLHLSEVAEVLRNKTLDVARLRAHAMQQPRLVDYARLPWLNRARKAHYARALSRSTWAPVPSQPLVFFPLHVQPEASVDWYGHEWRDQIDVARVLAAALARKGVCLVVKDHSNFVWNRGSWFHEQLMSVPNAHVVDPATDSRALARDAVFTFTVSGTTGLECGLQGLPVAVVSDHPWAALPSVTRVPTRTALLEHVDAGTFGVDANETGISTWYDDYWHCGFDGFVMDKHSRPSVLDHDNVAQIGRALAEFVSQERAGLQQSPDPGTGGGSPEP